MSGVMAHLPFDRAWIAAAIPEAQITAVRLRAEDGTLVSRLRAREVGSGLEEQIERTLRQAKRLAGETAADILTLVTDHKTPQQLAATVLDHIGWCAERSAATA